MSDHPSRSRSVNLIAGSVIFIVTLTVFLFSPVYQVTDSMYSMLLTESLIKHRTFTLDQYGLSRDPIDRQLTEAGGHIYYRYPPGSSVLSIPFVAAMNLFGVSATNPDGAFDQKGEVRQQVVIAAILMAAFSVVVFLTARLILPVNWSAIVTVAARRATSGHGSWRHLRPYAER